MGSGRRPFIPEPRRMPAWDTYGMGAIGTLVYTPLLLISPVLDLYETGHAAFGWPLLLVVAAASVTAVLAAYSTYPHAGRIALTALSVQFSATVAVTGHYWPSGYALGILLVVTIGSVGPPVWVPRMLLVVVLGDSALLWALSGDWTPAWTTALTTFLAGFSTYLFHRLLSTVAELRATRRELVREAVDRERLRFSRDLHDLLGHTLSVIVVKAEVIRRLGGDAEAVSRHAADVEEIGRGALKEVREAVTGYRDAGVARELDRAKIALDAAGIELRTTRTGDALVATVDSLFAWVIREAVTNVIRHSSARHCDIAIASDGAYARVAVTDDGRTAKSTVGGAGLQGLRERASAAGGTLDVHVSRHGFTLSAEVALVPEGAA